MKKDTDFLERYRKVQVKFKLPHFQELKRTFQFEIEEEDRPFDQIRMEISDRLFVFTEKIIEPLISGPESLANVIEQEMINDEERQKFFKLYSKIQMIKWENNVLSIDGNEEEMIKWIKNMWDFWNVEMKPELLKVCKKMSINWKELKNEKEKTHYHS